MNDKKIISLAIAGHVDHGKTSLVWNLTNKDTDRLKEEKERGLSINIAFAFLEQDDVTISLIDLPGHNKFIDNMVVGASSVNGAILVIAADDGIMPQTIEHINILKLLGVKYFLPVITKIDLVFEEQSIKIKDEVENYLKKTKLKYHESILFSNKNLKNLSELKKIIFDFSKQIEIKTSYNPFRMDIDRSFDLKGLGTIVTGTCKYNSLILGDELELLPQRFKFFVKEMQSNEKKVEQVYPGQRVAIRVPTINWKEIRRGDILSVPDSTIEAKSFSVTLNLINQIPKKINTDIKIYAGCKTLKAKFKLIGIEEEIYGQIILDKEWNFNRWENCLVKFNGDKTIDKSIKIIRESTPINKKTKKEELQDLKILNFGNIYERTILSIKLDKNKIVDSNKLYCELCIDDFQEDENLITYKQYVIHKKNYKMLSKIVLKKLQAYHLKKPLSPGVDLNSISTYVKSYLTKESFSIFFMMMRKMGEIKIDRGTFSLKHFEIKLSEEQSKIKNFILNRLKTNNYNIKSIEIIKEKIENKRVFNQILKYLVDIKSIVMLDYEYYITSWMYNSMIERISKIFSSEKSMSVANFFSIFGLDSQKGQKYLFKLVNDKKININNGEITLLI